MAVWHLGQGSMLQLNYDARLHITTAGSKKHEPFAPKPLLSSAWLLLIANLYSDVKGAAELQLRLRVSQDAE